MRVHHERSLILPDRQESLPWPLPDSRLSRALAIPRMVLQIHSIIAWLGGDKSGGAIREDFLQKGVSSELNIEVESPEKRILRCYLAGISGGQYWE